nr:mechanosensitive ion channel domain-containing protein [Pirellula staleyi]
MTSHDAHRSLGFTSLKTCTLLVACFLLLLAMQVPAQAAEPADHEQPASTSKNESTEEQVGERTTVLKPVAEEVETISAAEQITRLQRAVQNDNDQISELREELADPMSEYKIAEAEFQQLETKLQAISAQLNDPMKLAPDEITVLQTERDEIAEKHKLARDRFDLAIESRRTIHDQIAALEEKLRQDQAALDRVSGNLQPAASATTKPAGEMPADSLASSDAADAANSPENGSPKATSESPASEKTSDKSAASQSPMLPGIDLPATPIFQAPAKAPSKELLAAEDEAKLRKELAEQAERDAKSVTDRIVSLDKSIELENKQLAASRKRSDLAYQSAQAMEREKEKLRIGGASEEQLAAIREQREKAEAHFQAARAEVAERIDRVNQLQSQRALLQREELAAIAEAKLKLEEATTAEANVTNLRNPFSPHNLIQWFLDHGPKIGVILISMLALRWFLSLANHRFVQMMAIRGARGTQQEREDRARTLVGVFHNAASGAIVVSGTLMIFEEVGIAVAPLMGGAAVVGLAVAFGAQNLIRDYFYGFVILLENQYKLNDVLKIGDIAGQVEQITLRMTVLRDIEGNVHFIPNGKIDSVTNMTHGWSRAVLDVPVAYDEDIDRVMQILMDVATLMRRDPEYAWQIIDDPEMLGIEALGDSAVAVKFLIKTRPLSKHPIRRELLRRIKRKFDELGIIIPFQQRVVHHRYDEMLDSESDVPGLLAPPRSKKRA